MIASILLLALLSLGQPDPLAEARIALAAGRLDQADAMMRTAAKRGVDRGELQSLAADLAYARGDHSQAFAHYHHQLVDRPDDKGLLERAALSAMKSGLPDANPLMKRACSTETPSWVLLNACGVMADRNRRFEEARSFYGRAAALRPGSASVASNLGWSFMLEGRWSAARAPLERALRADPNHPRANANLAMLDMLEARDLPERGPAEDASGFARRLNDAGVAAVARGEPSRAIAAFARALAEEPVFYRRAADNLFAVEAAQ